MRLPWLPSMDGHYCVGETGVKIPGSPKERFLQGLIGLGDLGRFRYLGLLKALEAPFGTCPAMSRARPHGFRFSGSVPRVLIYRMEIRRDQQLIRHAGPH